MHIKAGDAITEGLQYDGVAYRYDDKVFFLGLRDLTGPDEAGRNFTVWCALPHRFAVRLDDARVVDVTVNELAEDEAIACEVNAVRHPQAHSAG